jgi:hypothetical protein
MNVCDRMTEDWTAISATPAAAARLAAWAEHEVALAGYRTPAALVTAAVGSDREQRAGVLSALIRQGRDPFAARTALQLLLPALTRVPLFVGYRCTPIASPGDDPDTARTELLGAAWEELAVRAGTEVTDPEMRIARSAADRLRTRRRRDGRSARRVQPSDNLGDGAAVELDWARSAAEHILVALADAVSAGTITTTEANLLAAVHVAGMTRRQVGQLHGVGEDRVRYRVRLAAARLARTSA